MQHNFKIFHTHIIVIHIIGNVCGYCGSQSHRGQEHPHGKSYRVEVDEI